jgi:hypothetical protein
LREEGSKFFLIVPRNVPIFIAKIMPVFLYRSSVWEKFDKYVKYIDHKYQHIRFDFMNVILLQHDHTHVSATHVAIFRVMENKNTDIKFNVYGSVHRIANKMQPYTVYFIWKLLWMFRVVPSNNCIYSIWYLLHCNG